MTTARAGRKAGDPPAELTALSDRVDFSEELRSVHMWTGGYEIRKADTSDKHVTRYTVTLRLRDRKGTVTDREAMYAVTLKNPLVASRDSYS